MASRDEDISTNTTAPGSWPGMNFSPMTLEEEALAGGWTRITRPVGGNDPLPAPVVGTRGDPDLDSDQVLWPGTGSTVTDD